MINIETRTYQDNKDYMSLIFSNTDDLTKSLAVSFRTNPKDYDEFLSIIHSAAKSLDCFIDNLNASNSK